MFPRSVLFLSFILPKNSSEHERGHWKVTGSYHSNANVPGNAHYLSYHPHLNAFCTYSPKHWIWNKQRNFRSWQVLLWPRFLSIMYIWEAEDNILYPGSSTWNSPKTEFLGSWLQPGPTSVLTGIWAVNGGQQASVSISLSFKYEKIHFKNLKYLIIKFT